MNRACPVPDLEDSHYEDIDPDTRRELIRSAIVDKAHDEALWENAYGERLEVR